MVNIHIIEDDWGVRDALMELVQGLGHRVLTYPDAEAFLDGASPAAEDIIFVDLGLPGVSGAELIQRLRSLTRPPRIVAISGRPWGDVEIALRALPGLTLLRKPLAPEAIAAQL